MIINENSVYDDYVDKWITNHPFQEFFLGLDISYGYDRIPYIIPNKNGFHFYSISLYIVIIILATYITSIGEIPFVFGVYIFGCIVVCHLIYMYYFVSLPYINKNFKFTSRFVISKFLCILGLFIPLCLFYFNLVNYIYYLNFYTKYDVNELYNEELIRKNYWNNYFYKGLKIENKNNYYIIRLYL